MNDVKEFAKSIIENPVYRSNLVERLKAGRVASSIVEMLKKYARGVNEDGRAYARGILTEADVSWEKTGT
jgi:hypothetical protein